LKKSVWGLRPETIAAHSQEHTGIIWAAKLPMFMLSVCTAIILLVCLYMHKKNLNKLNI